MAGAEGFEPSALGFGDRCSDQTELRPYRPKPNSTQPVRSRHDRPRTPHVWRQTGGTAGNQGRVWRAASRGQRNTSPETGRVCLQKGGVFEAREVPSEAAANRGRDSGAMGATKGRRGWDPNRSPYGPVLEVGPSPCSCGRRDSATAAEEVASCSQPAGARGNLAWVGSEELAAGHCIEDWEVALDGRA